jgi:ATPase subunit of ABC transporter with duplicated ATPase domains
MDELYLDYNDKNADRIGELQVQFEEMSGWSADSDAAAMLSNLGIGEEHHFTLMADLEAKLRFVFFGTLEIRFIDYG